MKIFHLPLFLFFIINKFCTVTKSQNVQTILASDFNGKKDEKQKEESTLKVKGSATTQISTDLIVVSATVVTKRPDASKALRLNNLSFDSLLSEVRGLGINEELISSTGFSLTPKYNSTLGPNNTTYYKVFDGYEVKNSISARLIDLELAGRLIDSFASIPGVQIDNVEFTVAPEWERKIKDSLIEASIEDAIEKANKVLKKVNYEIKRIDEIEVESGSAQDSPLFKYASRMASTEEATPLLSGTKEVSLNIEFKFIIGPIS